MSSVMKVGSAVCHTSVNLALLPSSSASFSCFVMTAVVVVAVVRV